MSYPRVAIIYLTFHPDSYLDEAVAAFKNISYPKENIEFVVVDNPHPEYGSSARYLTETLLPLSGHELSHVTIIPQKENRGFAGGNNVGIQWALDNNFDYVFLHNDDGFMDARCLETLVAAMEKDKQIGAAQALLLLYPESELINSAGNSFHYLGIGFCNFFRRPLREAQLPPILEINYASGAALLLRVDLIKQYGALDEDFFLYHEDLEYGMRLKAAGYRSVLVPEAKFYHQYNFSRNSDKFYYIERNRLGVLLMFYKWPTLLLILPAALIWEMGMLIFAASKGWLDVKFKVYLYWCQGSSWRLWLAKRKKIQQSRRAGDRQLLSQAVGRIIFEEKSINNNLLRLIGNPFLAAYWWVIRRLIFW